MTFGTNIHQAQQRPRKAVIPAAGSGTRLLPATKSQAKEMLLVGRKPVIQHVAEEIQGAGINKILIVTNQKKRALEDHFDPHLNHFSQLQEIDNDIEFFYTRQSHPKGLADAISKAETFVNNEPFVVCLGDSIIQSKPKSNVLDSLIETYMRNQANASILFEEVALESVVKYGIAAPDFEQGLTFSIADIVEKPSVDKAPSNLAVAARYVFSPEIFDYIRQTKPGRNNEIQITDSIRLALQNQGRVFGLKLDHGEKRFDIGNYRAYFEAFFRFSLADPEFGSEFREYAKKMLEL